MLWHVTTAQASYLQCRDSTNTCEIAAISSVRYLSGMERGSHRAPIMYVSFLRVILSQRFILVRCDFVADLEIDWRGGAVWHSDAVGMMRKKNMKEEP